jgi:hypothetical protein
MTQTLKISTLEFKVTMINMLRDPMEKNQYAGRIGSRSREMETQSKRNSRYQKQCNRNEECI